MEHIESIKARIDFLNDLVTAHPELENWAQVGIVHLTHLSKLQQKTNFIDLGPSVETKTTN